VSVASLSSVCRGYVARDFTASVKDIRLSGLSPASLRSRGAPCHGQPSADRLTDYDGEPTDTPTTRRGRSASPAQPHPKRPRYIWSKKLFWSSD